MLQFLIQKMCQFNLIKLIWPGISGWSFASHLYPWKCNMFIWKMLWRKKINTLKSNAMIFFSYYCVSFKCIFFLTHHEKGITPSESLCKAIRVAFFVEQLSFEMCTWYAMRDKFLVCRKYKENKFSCAIKRTRIWVNDK